MVDAKASSKIVTGGSIPSSLSSYPALSQFYAGVAQWQSTALPTLGRRIDTVHLLHFTFLAGMKDIVILLPGCGNYILPIADDQQETLDAQLKDMGKNIDKWIELNGVKQQARLSPRAILGWYFRPHVEEVTATQMQALQKKLAEAGIEFMSQAGGDIQQGEDWKKEGGDGS